MGADPHRRRKHAGTRARKRHDGRQKHTPQPAPIGGPGASATDASLDDACDQPPTNTFCPSFKLAPTNFNTDFPALTRRKVATKPTCFVL